MVTIVPSSSTGDPFVSSGRCTIACGGTVTVSRQYWSNKAAGLVNDIPGEAELTPEQVETVKNKMTYKKVKVTYDAYCAIVPNLTEKDKAKILEVLKEAREEAIVSATSPDWPRSALDVQVEDEPAVVPEPAHFAEIDFERIDPVYSFGRAQFRTDRFDQRHESVVVSNAQL